MRPLGQECAHSPGNCTPCLWLCLPPYQWEESEDEKSGHILDQGAESPVYSHDASVYQSHRLHSPRGCTLAEGREGAFTSPGSVLPQRTLRPLMAPAFTPSIVATLPRLRAF